MALAGLLGYFSDSSEDDDPQVLIPVETPLLPVESPLVPAPVESPLLAVETLLLPVPEQPTNGVTNQTTSIFRNRARSTDCPAEPKLNISDDDEPYKLTNNHQPKSSSKRSKPLAEPQLDPQIDTVRPVVPHQLSDVIEKARVVSVDRESLKIEEGAISVLLPQPKVPHPGAVHETELECLQRGKRKKKGKKKIFALQLEDYEETEAPKTKKVHHSSSKSGLFSLLPDPKHCTGVGSRINVDLKKRVPIAGKNKAFAGLVPRTITKKALTNKEEEEECLEDFFSFDKSEKEQTELQSKAGEIQLESFIPKKVARTAQPPKYFKCTEAPTMDNVQGGQSEPVVELDSQVLAEGIEVPEYVPPEFRDLQFNSADIVDVNQVIPSTEDWALKHLDYNDNKPQSSTKCNIAGQAKRKHQITYLAWQAKEKEAELQNNWASNKMNRFATQNKYGFR